MRRPHHERNITYIIGRYISIKDAGGQKLQCVVPRLVVNLSIFPIGGLWQSVFSADRA